MIYGRKRVNFERPGSFDGVASGKQLLLVNEGTVKASKIQNEPQFKDCNEERN